MRRMSEVPEKNIHGVIGMNLTDGDEVVGMQMNTQGDALIVSKKVLARATPYSKNFTPQD